MLVCNWRAADAVVCAGLQSIFHLADGRSLELTALNVQKHGCPKSRRERIPDYLASAESALPSLHTSDSTSFYAAMRRHIAVGDYASCFRSGRPQSSQRFALSQRKASALAHAANEVFRKPIYGLFVSMHCCRVHAGTHALLVVRAPQARLLAPTLSQKSTRVCCLDIATTQRFPWAGTHRAINKSWRRLYVS